MGLMAPVLACKMLCGAYSPILFIFLCQNKLSNFLLVLVLLPLRQANSASHPSGVSIAE